MKRALAGAVLVTALALASCASAEDYEEQTEQEPVETEQTVSSSLPTGFTEHVFTASDGTVVMCFTWSEDDWFTDSTLSGMSCFPAPNR